MKRCENSCKDVWHIDKQIIFLHSTNSSFKNILSRDNFKSKKEDKSGHLQALQHYASSWLWYVPNFKNLEGLISEDHMWHIIVQRTYIQTYCIQICKNKWITIVNISGFISAVLFEQCNVWLGIQAGKNCTSPDQPDRAWRLTNRWSRSQYQLNFHTRRVFLMKYLDVWLGWGPWDWAQLQQEGGQTPV